MSVKIKITIGYVFLKKMLYQGLKNKYCTEGTLIQNPKEEVNQITQNCK